MKKRILSALLIFTIVVPLIYLGGRYFSLGILLISMFAYRELLNLNYNKNKIPILMQVIGFISTIAIILSSSEYSFAFGINYKILIGLIIIFLVPLLFYKDKNYNSKDAFYMIGSVLFLGISFSLMLLIRNYDLHLIIYLFLIGVVSDVYAFITGNLIGKRKLLKEVSPCKTIEGMIGGLIFGTFAPVMYYITVIDSGISTVDIIGMTFFLCSLGIFGDLCFSNIKRYFGVKDFSDIIPGHGGILDRFDSIIFIMLGFMFFVNFIGG